MRIVTTALLLALATATPLAADEAWAAALETGVRALAAAPGASPVSPTVLRLALESAARHLGDDDPAAAAPLVYAAAIRAELRWRLGEPLPRVRAGLAQECRIVRRAGEDAAERLRTLERVRRNLERAAPGTGGRAVPWWERPGVPRGRTGG
jgi:hypothetical protein